MAAALELVSRAKKIVVNGQPLRIGVGIHSGPAVVGALGGGRRSDYTAIGSTVNVAARLCGIAKAEEVLVSSEALGLAGSNAVCVPGERVRLKGLDYEIVPYTLQRMAGKSPILLSVEHR
jgi:adenylate cyclase